MTTVNGWRNWETNEFVLTNDNDEGSYKYWQRVMRLIFRDKADTDGDKDNAYILPSARSPERSAMIKALKAELDEYVDSLMPEVPEGLARTFLQTSFSEIDTAEIAKEWIHDFLADLDVETL